MMLHFATSRIRIDGVIKLFFIALLFVVRIFSFALLPKFDKMGTMSPQKPVLTMTQMVPFGYKIINNFCNITVSGVT